MNKTSVFVPVFGFNPGVGEAFWRDLVLAPGSQTELPVEDKMARLELVRMQDQPDEAVQATLEKADSAVLLVKYLDTQSLERIKRVYQAVLRQEIPLTILMIRDTKEAQFRMSCTHCDQNLWVRDRSVGQKGKCRACGKMFYIPAQAAYLTSSLMLTDASRLRSLTLGDKNSAALMDEAARVALGLERNTSQGGNRFAERIRKSADSFSFARRITSRLAWLKS